MDTAVHRTLIRIGISIGVSMLILAGLIHLVFRSTDQSLTGQLALLFSSFSWAVVGVYAVIALVGTLLRAYRFKVLTVAAGAPAPPRLRHFFLVTAVRNMLVDMLPARLGELSYIAMLNRGYRVDGGSCVSSLVVSFVFDVIALGVLFAAMLATQVLLHQFHLQLLVVMVVLVLLAALMLLAVFKFIPLLQAWVRRTGMDSRLGALGHRLADFLDQLKSAVVRTRSAGVFGLTLLLSVGIRCIKYGSLFLLFTHVVTVLELAKTGISPLNVLMGLVGAEAAASIPVPSFMAFGTYETGGVVAMGLLGVGKAEAMITFLGIHIVTQTIDYILGGIGGVVFIMLTPSWRSAKAPSAAPKTAIRARRWIWAAAVVLFCLAGGAFLAREAYKTRKMGRFLPPEPGEAIASPTGSRPVAGPASELSGFVVWSSNRFGNHDLLYLSLPDMRLRRLTQNAHTEYFPRISPDGKRVVFARSQQPWVSQRNQIPWDVWMLELSSGKESLVARNGNAPTWSEDGERVFFQRNANQFVSHHLATGKETVLYGPGKGQLAPSVKLETPSFSDTRNRIAVTLRGSKRATALLEPSGAVKIVGQGCQLNWSPRGVTLYQVDEGGRKKNAIYQIDPESLKRTMLLDMPGDYSHEYFPKASNDGSVLVFGASAVGHEHDSADYEIFLWRIGSPASTAQRLTFHTGNDCWPDVYLFPVDSRS
ncbi:MAG: lysylphosphatidylglycerol synthase domain-containing protein [Desulfobacteraceae bacterium]|nr:lysylphosphatidylglycerol synthase domain-containing protein [Desulfobacteraceae bacterium]